MFSRCIPKFARIFFLKFFEDRRYLETKYKVIINTRLNQINKYLLVKNYYNI